MRNEHLLCRRGGWSGPKLGWTPVIRLSESTVSSLAFKEGGQKIYFMKILALVRRVDGFSSIS